tara:strand:+ start:33 stop:305 length:273 start_codon:yes stop_codon:yes gene_type:complete
MEKDFNSLIRLLKDALNTDSPTNLDEIEKEIQILSSKISSKLESESEKININQNNLDELKILIEKIAEKNEENKEFFLEFKNFLENRKIK